MGTALVIGITVTLRLIILGVEAFVLGKPPPTGPAEKGGSVSHLSPIARKRRYEQAEDVRLYACFVVSKTQMMNTSIITGEEAMQTNYPIMMKQRNKHLLACCFSVLLSLGPIVFQPEAFAENLDASWVHGNSIHHEQPTAMSINYFGFGSILTLPAANRFTIGGWVHFAIPTPTIEDGVRSKLNQILISHEGTATIDIIDVWDGPNKIAGQPVLATGDHVNLNSLTVVDLPSDPLIFWGVTISIHVVNNCFDVTCPQQYMRFVAAGGDFLN